MSRKVRLLFGVLAGVLGSAAVAGGIFSKEFVAIEGLPLWCRVECARLALIDPRVVETEKQVIRRAIRTWYSDPQALARTDFESGKRCVSVVLGFTGVYPDLGGLPYGASRPDDYRDCYIFGGGCVDSSSYQALDRAVGLAFSSEYNRTVTSLGHLRVLGAGA